MPLIVLLLALALLALSMLLPIVTGGLLGAVLGGWLDPDRARGMRAGALYGGVAGIAFMVGSMLIGRS